jgi:hypothetical protein
MWPPSSVLKNKPSLLSRWFLRNVCSLSTDCNSTVSLPSRIQILPHHDRYCTTCISVQYNTNFIQRGNLKLDRCSCEEVASLQASLGTWNRKPRPQDGSKSLGGHHLLGAHFIVSAITFVLIALGVSQPHPGKHTTRELLSLSQTPYNLWSMYRTTNLNFSRRWLWSVQSSVTTFRENISPSYISWYITPCSPLKNNRYFRGTHFLNLQVRRMRQRAVRDLKKWTIFSSETFRWFSTGCTDVYHRRHDSS